ncbi:MAG TPA: iron ABC transporter permease [Egibacteraceae bacterium]|nr:iron ABC transporter permease [Egibacteraceae bacterium]
MSDLAVDRRPATDSPVGPSRPARREGRPRRRARRSRAPAWLWVPALLVAVVMLLPLVYLAVRASEAGRQGLAIAADPATVRVLANTALLAGLVTAAGALLAIPLAWLTTRTNLPGRRLWSVLTALPLVIPSYVGAFTYIAAFGPRGMLQSVLAPLGVERLPDIYGMPGAVLTLTLFTYPYLLLTVRGALLGMDPALEEASRSLGHSPARTFRRVTLPQLRPAIGAGALLVALYTLSDFGAVSLMRFNSFTRAIYVQYQAAFDRTPAAVLAALLVLFTLALLAVEARTRRRVRYHSSHAGAPRSQPVVELGRWRGPALALCSTVVVLGLVVPLSVMGFWLARGLRAGEPLRLVATAAVNSVQAAGLAAAVAAAAAVPVALLAARHRSRVATLIERATYLGHALPGIVVALSLVFFGARYAGRLYQTLALLVFAYVVLFLPQAVGATRASALQIPPSVEEAARGLGRRVPAVLLTVTAPLIRPGVLAGAALVFLTAMKELPATLLLGPAGYTTLATSIWIATSEAFFARAAAPALMLVALAGVPLAFLLARHHRLGGTA